MNTAVNTAVLEALAQYQCLEWACLNAQRCLVSAQREYYYAQFASWGTLPEKLDRFERADDDVERWEKQLRDHQLRMVEAEKGLIEAARAARIHGGVPLIIAAITPRKDTSVPSKNLDAGGNPRPRRRTA